MGSYEGRWALPRRELAFYRSFPATNELTDGPGKSWAILLCGSTFFGPWLSNLKSPVQLQVLPASAPLNSSNRFARPMRRFGNRRREWSLNYFDCRD
jgi:hypothetical protein